MVLTILTLKWVMKNFLVGAVILWAGLAIYAIGVDIYDYYHFREKKK